MFRSIATAALVAAPVITLTGTIASSQQPLRVSITEEVGKVTVQTPNGPVEIMRDQAEGAVLDPEWALTGRDCPPFCIQPHSPAEGTHTIGELELLAALEDPDTIVVDSRVPDWYATGTIPGSINIPFTQAVERLGDLGCEPDFDGKFDCTNASKVVLFCNGLWCGQSPSAIRAMIDAGFPADRISYYRGGMQSWRLLGLTVQGGGNPQPEGVTPAAADPAAEPMAEAETAPEAEAAPEVAPEAAPAEAEATAETEAAPDAPAVAPDEAPTLEQAVQGVVDAAQGEVDQAVDDATQLLKDAVTPPEGGEPAPDEAPASN